MKNESFIDPNLSHYINVRKRHRMVNARRLAHAQTLFAKVPNQSDEAWKKCVSIAWRDVH